MKKLVVGLIVVVALLPLFYLGVVTASWWNDFAVEPAYQGDDFTHPTRWWALPALTIYALLPWLIPIMGSVLIWRGGLHLLRRL